MRRHLPGVLMFRRGGHRASGPFDTQLKTKGLKEAIQSVRQRFPFPGYIDATEASCINVCRAVQHWLPLPARILDVGAGPCDKTAVLSFLGYECTACDDLEDSWHGVSGNREHIVEFAKNSGIEYCVQRIETNLPFRDAEFDMIILNDVLEHLHESPRDMLLRLVRLLKASGLLLITVPNAANLRKRFRLLVGKTNLPSFEYYFWNPGPWRGHIREYVREDLELLVDYLGLEAVELRACHHMLRAMPRALRPVWVGLTFFARNSRDTWLLVARKGKGWLPRGKTPAEIRQITTRFTPLEH